MRNVTFLELCDAFAAICAIIFSYVWWSAGPQTPPEKVARFRRGAIGMLLFVVLISLRLVLHLKS